MTYRPLWRGRPLEAAAYPPPIALIAMLLVPVQAVAGEPPSRYGVDAPELARLGPYAVGIPCRWSLSPGAGRWDREA